MGTPLTSATVSSTYQALLKVGNNTAISSSMKKLSDGLGNDIPLYVSDKSITSLGGGDFTGNTVFGELVLASNLSGTDNTGFGYNALGACTTGFGNLAIGNNAMSEGLNPSNNIAIGEGALQKITTGSTNIAIGRNCLANLTSYSSTIAIGNDITATATNGLAIGHGASVTSVGQIAIGSVANSLGTLRTESVSSTKTFEMKINGVVQKFLLA